MPGLPVQPRHDVKTIDWSVNGYGLRTAGACPVTKAIKITRHLQESSSGNSVQDTVLKCAGVWALNKGQHLKAVRTHNTFVFYPQGVVNGVYSRLYTSVEWSCRPLIAIPIRIPAVVFQVFLFNHWIRNPYVILASSEWMGEDLS